MGAWGEGPFDNDDAADWVYDLETASDFTFVRQTLAAVDVPYLESPDGSTAIAAAEAAAAALGKPRHALPDAVTAWVAAHGAAIEDGDRQLALHAVERVLAPDSELQGLWADTGSGTWAADVRGLRERLATT